MQLANSTSRAHRHGLSFAVAVLTLYAPIVSDLRGQTSGKPADTSAAARQEQLQQRNQLVWEAGRLFQAGKIAEARAALDQMLTVERAVFGKDHDDIAGALEHVARFHDKLTDFEAARAALQEALAIRTRAQGADHWQTVDARFALARLDRLVKLDEDQRRSYREAQRLLGQAGRLGRAYQAQEQADLLRQAGEVLKTSLGNTDPEYATVLLEQARQGGPAEARLLTPEKARPLCAEAVKIRKDALGETHPDYAGSLEALALLDRGGAALLRQALAVRKKAQGPVHPDVARCLERLARACQQERRRDEAIACFEEELAIYQQLFGNDLRAGTVMGYLASLYEDAGDTGRALRLLQQGAEIRRDRLDRDNNVLAGFWITTLGAPPESFPVPRRTLNAAAQRYTYAFTLQSLAAIQMKTGAPREAGRVFGESMDLLAEGVSLAAASLSEGEQQSNVLGFGLQRLERYLSLSLDPRAEVSAEEAYRHLLTWKGAHFARQRQARQWRKQPDLAPLYAELERLGRQIGDWAAKAPGPEDRQAWSKVSGLLARKEELEADLAGQVVRLGQARRQERTDVARLQGLLPPDAALVDFLEFFPWFGDVSQKQHLLAFVVRPGKPVQRLDLGPMWPVIEAIEVWRAKAARSEDLRAAGATLRRLLWQPLQPHLEGVRTLLISPDAELCTFSLAALPGEKPDSFLIEELGLAVVPVPQLLLAGDEQPSPRKDLLLVGDVDFDAEAGPALRPEERARGGPAAPGRAPGRALPAFAPLPGTRSELERVQETFVAVSSGGVARRLQGQEATKQAFRKAVTECRYVHLATHGFFLPVGPGGVPSALTLAPAAQGLGAAVAFTGANRPPQADREDGILTALEAQELDLDGVELAVLSACETGLGTRASGEGLMSLQRAFQVAGARSLVSSLWQVDDAATSVLMEEFYGNLWRKKLSKQEALRQAQLTVLKHPERVEQRHKELAADLAKRGVKLGASKALTEGGKVEGRSYPALWAAFVLSGDLR